jgi:hypothetical protein
MAQAVCCRFLSAHLGFAPGSVHVEFVVDKVALGQVFLRVIVSPAVIIPPWLSMLIYRLGQLVPQFRDVVSPTGINNNNVQELTRVTKD